MSKHSCGAILLAAATAWALPATGETVYRCGDSYSQKPCPGGKPVAAEDERTPAQRAQTTEAVRRQAAAADQMERDRLKEEAKPPNVAIPPAGAQAAPEQRDRTESLERAKKPKYFTAIAPKKPGEATPKKKKAKAKAKKAAKAVAKKIAG